MDKQKNNQNKLFYLKKTQSISMQIDFLNNQITFEKELNELDNLTIEFTSVLNKNEIKYSLVSGYVAILFGRNRASEDIDIIIEKIDEQKFKNLWNDLLKGFECINAFDAEMAYNDYLLEKISLRFSKKNQFIPNIEVKFPKAELDYWTLEERKKLVLNNFTLFISPLELQIPYKLVLGSEKDLEDARYLYKLFKDKIDLKLLNKFIEQMNVKKEFEAYLQ